MGNGLNKYLIVVILFFCGCVCVTTKQEDDSQDKLKNYLSAYSAYDLQLITETGIHLMISKEKRDSDSFYIYPDFLSEISFHKVQLILDSIEYHIPEKEFLLIKECYFELQKNFSVNGFVFKERDPLVKYPFKDDRPIFFIGPPIIIKEKKNVIVSFLKYWAKGIKGKGDKGFAQGLSLIMRKRKNGKWVVENQVSYTIDHFQINYSVN